MFLPILCVYNQSRHFIKTNKQNPLNVTELKTLCFLVTGDTERTVQSLAQLLMKPFEITLWGSWIPKSLCCFCAVRKTLHSVDSSFSAVCTIRMTEQDTRHLTPLDLTWSVAVHLVFPEMTERAFSVIIPAWVIYLRLLQLTFSGNTFQAGRDLIWSQLPERLFGVRWGDYRHATGSCSNHLLSFGRVQCLLIMEKFLLHLYGSFCLPLSFTFFGFCKEKKSNLYFFVFFFYDTYSHTTNWKLV